MSHWDFGRPPARERDDWPPDADDAATEGAAEACDTAEDDDLAPYPITYERDPWYPAASGYHEAGQDEVHPDPEPAPRPPSAADAWADWETGRARRRRRPGFRRWLFPAGIAAAAAALGAGAVLLANGHPGGTGSQAPRGSGGASAPPASGGTTPGSPSAPGSASGSGSAAAPLTLAQAQAVLAAYTAGNNKANAQRSDPLLGLVETGASYSIDVALYRQQRAAGASPYAPFSPVHATYYIPRAEPSAGPRWFVVQVSNAFTASPAKISSTEYLLFTQPVPGAVWRNAIEPYLLSGASTTKIALGADGLATAVSPGTAADAVAPGQLPAVTAASLDRADLAGADLDGADSGQSVVADPGNLADDADLRLWRKEVPEGKVSAAHAPATGSDGQEFALLTDGGGALVFYTDSASLTVTPPAGSVLHVTIPGFLTPGQALTRTEVDYLEQFAAYDPPAGGGAPRVVADFSAITGTS
ncbi:MAG TPA: hypothetical protein VGM12_00760 [Trebonia sp.]